jgi:hypothetical protein
LWTGLVAAGLRRGHGTRHEGGLSMRIHAAVASALVALASAQAASPPVLLEPLAGRQVFPASNWWNQDISAARSTRVPIS